MSTPVSILVPGPKSGRPHPGRRWRFGTGSVRRLPDSGALLEGPQWGFQTRGVLCPPRPSDCTEIYGVGPPSRPHVPLWHNDYPSDSVSRDPQGPRPPPVPTGHPETTTDIHSTWGVCNRVVPSRESTDGTPPTWAPLPRPRGRCWSPPVPPTVLPPTTHPTPTLSRQPLLRTAGPDLATVHLKRFNIPPLHPEDQNLPRDSPHARPLPVAPCLYPPSMLNA